MYLIVTIYYDGVFIGNIVLTVLGFDILKYKYLIIITILDCHLEKFSLSRLLS